MKGFRTIAVLLFSAALVFLIMEGNAEFRQKEAAGKVTAPLERGDIPKLHMRQEQKDLCIELNRVVFEKKRVILDYTLESPDLSQYEELIVRFQKGELMVGCAVGFAVEEAPEKKRMVAYVDTEGGFFSREDVGEEVVFVFESLYGAKLNSGVQMSFPVTIEKVFAAQTVEVNQGFPYEGGSALVQSVEVSPFYTDVRYVDKGAKEAFLTELYGWEVVDESGKALQCLGGGGNEYHYTALPEGCKEIGLTLIQYKQDASYDKLGEMVEIPLR